MPALYALWFRVRADEPTRATDAFEAESARPFDPSRIPVRLAAE